MAFSASFSPGRTQPSAVEETKNAMRMSQKKGPPAAKITVPTATPTRAPPGSTEPRQRASTEAAPLSTSPAASRGADSCKDPRIQECCGEGNGDIVDPQRREHFHDR